MKIILISAFLFSLLFLASKCENIVGLKNFGETCYANAVFQMLYHNKNFRKSLQKYLVEVGPHRANQNLSALNRTFLKMDEAAKESSVQPETFKALPANFLPHTQYDVAEVLAQYQSIPHLDWSPFAIKFKDKKMPESFSTIEIDLELFLNVPEREPINLNDLLTNHFKDTIIESLPKNLIIRIKRLHQVNGVDEKITTRIPVPESLSLLQFSSASPQFNLDSFIEHRGDRANGGHYVFYLHHQESKEYYAINDEKIKKITPQDFLEGAANAYMFLYREYQ